jgi:hypothetical protein
VKKHSSLVTIVFTLMSGRTALNRIREAREDGDPWEVLDAALNVAVLVTGLIVVARRLRRGESEV